MADQIIDTTEVDTDEVNIKEDTPFLSSDEREKLKGYGLPYQPSLKTPPQIGLLKKRDEAVIKPEPSRSFTTDIIKIQREGAEKQEAEEHIQEQIKIKKETEEIVESISDPNNNQNVNIYGTFSSTLDIDPKSGVYTDQDGNIHNAIYTVQPHGGFREDGQVISTEHHMPPMPLQELFDEQKRRDDVVVNSADVTFGEDPVHYGPELETVSKLEQVVPTGQWGIPEMSWRALYDSVPIAAGSLATRITKYGSVRILPATLSAPVSLSAGIFTAAYLMYNQDIYRPDQVEGIYQSQIEEYNSRKENGEYDGLPEPRLLDRAQIAERLDPQFASWWVKAVNYITYGFPASLTAIAVPGISLGYITAGKWGIASKYMRKASDEFADQAADAAKRNVPMLPPTRNMITQRARSMLLEDLEIESAHIYSRVARFIYGFGDKQIANQMQEPFMYPIKFAMGEIGATTLVATAAYSTLTGTGGLQTMTLDKALWAITGAITAPSMFGFPVALARKGAGLTVHIVNALAKTGAAGVDHFVNRPLVTALLDTPSKYMDDLYRYLDGGRANLPEGIAAAINPKTGALISMDEIVGLKKILQGVNDVYRGQLIKNLRYNMELVRNVDDLVRNSGKSELIKEWDALGGGKPGDGQAYALSVLTRIDLMGAIQKKYIADIFSVVPDPRMFANSTFMKMAAAQDNVVAESAQLQNMLYRLGGVGDELTNFSNNHPAYDTFSTLLLNKIQQSEEALTHYNNLVHDLPTYLWTSATIKLMRLANDGLTAPVSQHIKYMETLLEAHPEIIKRMKLRTDTGELLEEAEAMKVLKYQINNASREIYRNTQKGYTNVEKMLTELYDSNGTFKSTTDYRAQDAVTGPSVASNYEAIQRLARRDELYWKNRDNYSKVGSTPDDGFIDITDMFKLLRKQVTNPSMTLGAEQEQEIVRFINSKFRTNIHFGIDDFLKRLGGGDVDAGYNLIKEIAKNQKLIIPSRGKSFELADFLIENDAIMPGQFKFRINATLGEMEDLTKSFKDKNHYFYSGEHYKQFIKNRATKAKGAEAWGRVIKIAEKEYLEKLNTADTKQLKIAHGFYRDTYIPYRNSDLYKQSFGSIQGVDVSYVTGFKHSTNPAHWMDAWWKKVQTQDGASAWYEDFVRFYGPPEVTVAEKTVKNLRYYNALEAFDNYIQFKFHLLDEGAYVIDDAGNFSIPARDVDVTSIPFKEATRAYGVKPLYDDNTFSEISSGYQGWVKGVRNLEEATRGKYTLNLGHNTLEKLNNIIAHSASGRNIIKLRVHKIQGEIEHYQKTYKAVSDGFKKAQEIFAKELDIDFMNRGRPDKIVEGLLENPERIAKILAAIGDDPSILKEIRKIKGMEKFTEKDFLKYIFFEGMDQMTKAGQPETYTNIFGNRVTDIMTDGQRYAILLKDHAETLTIIFGKEHLKTMNLINKFLIAFIPRHQHAASQGYVGMKALYADDIKYSNTKIINRLWTTHIGKTNPSFLGIEAAVAMLNNVDYSAFSSLFLSKNTANKFLEFLTNPQMPTRWLKAGESMPAAWVDEWIKLASGGIEGTKLYYKQITTEEDHEFNQWLKNNSIFGGTTEENMIKWMEYKHKVGGNVIEQTASTLRDTLGDAMKHLGF